MGENYVSNEHNQHRGQVEMKGLMDFNLRCHKGFDHFYNHNVVGGGVLRYLGGEEYCRLDRPRPPRPSIGTGGRT